MLFKRIVKIILVDLAEIMLIVRTFRIHTFVDSKVFAVFDVTSVDRFDFFAVFPFEIRNIVFIVPNFLVDDLRELVNLELLIFRRMRITESTLSERDISADKI